MFSQPPTMIISKKKIDPDVKSKIWDARILGLQMLRTIKLFKPASIIISNRFYGPTYTGHGGYTAGTLAQYFSGLIEVTIKKPIPMDQKMALVAWKAGLRLGDEEKMAEAILTDIHPDRIEVPTALEAKNSRHFSCPDGMHSIPRVLCQAQSEKKLMVFGCLPV